MAINAEKKLAGLLIPAFALRRQNDLGIGDTQAVKEAIDFCALNKIAILQLLPINETGGDHSPYNAISANALEPSLLAIAPDTVPGLSNEQFEQIAHQQLATQLRSGTIDYPRVKKLKLDLLQCAFDNFEKGNATRITAQKKDFEAFENSNKNWLDSYVIFRTLVAEHGGDARWTQWDSAMQSPSAATAWIAKSPEAERLKRSCRFWSFVQWIAAKQWGAVKAYAQAANVQLMGDIPFGVSRYSADAWANRQLFDLDWSGGAPAEGFFQSDAFTRNWGQNWGIPLYKWQAHEDEKFAWWISRIQQTAQYCHYFRIDHVLGFFRIYAFPWRPEQNEEFANLSRPEAEVKTGGRLPQFMPHDDYPPELGALNCAQGKKRLNMIVKAAEQTGIVAEDLGTVPPYVRPLLKELGIPGFAIPQFEREKPNGNYKPKELLSPLSLCTYGTHDHEPLVTFYEHLVAWWHGPSGHDGWIEVQHLMNFLGLDPEHPPTEYTEALQFAFFRTLLETPCWLAVLMITDLLGSKQRFNEPGLSSNYNWSQRLDKPILDYTSDDKYASKIRYFKDLIGTTNRAPISNLKMQSLEYARKNN